LLSVSGWQSLRDLVIHDNPLTAAVMMTSSSCTRGGPGSSQLPHITQLLQQKLPIQVHWFVCFCVCYDISAIRHVIMGPSFLEGGFILC